MRKKIMQHDIDQMQYEFNHRVRNQIAEGLERAISILYTKARSVGKEDTAIWEVIEEELGDSLDRARARVVAGV